MKTFSKEWSELASRGGDIRQALALGERVELRIGEVVYVIAP